MKIKRIGPVVDLVTKPAWSNPQHTYMLHLHQLAPNDGNTISYINAQVERIFQDARFSSSGILKKFLRFIVTETLSGRAHLLKEYTIAVEVLRKPVTFNPQENCIVRVHAARLRKILFDYYTGPGAKDDMQIMLPKGHYVPVFRENRNEDLSVKRTISENFDPSPGEASAVHTIAVIPFHYSGNDAATAAVADALGLSLSTDLMKLKPPVSVISYSVMRLIGSSYKDFRDWELAVDPRYLFLGNVQRHRDSIRVTIQMVRAANYEQLWCHVYEHNIAPEGIFGVQDEIAAHVVKSVRRLGLLSGIRIKPHAIAAVA